MAKRLGRGVNILGYNPVWDDPASARFEEKHFKLIRDEGFPSVRINLNALQRMGPAPAYALDEKWLATLDQAVRSARAAESLDWAWVYWEFDSDFIVYDIDKDRWVGPVLEVLIPAR